MNWRAATRVADCDVHKIAASAVDWSSLREDFPILREQAHGHPLIYFDSAATSQKPRPVIEALRNFYEHDNANVHRGLHMLSSRATEAYEKARQRVAEYIGAARADEIIFTRRSTSSSRFCLAQVSARSLSSALTFNNNSNKTEGANSLI